MLYTTYGKNKNSGGIELGPAWRALNQEQNVDKKKKVYKMLIDTP